MAYVLVSRLQMVSFPGLMNIAGALPGFIGVYVAGYLLESSHGWSQVFNLTGALCLVGVVVYSAIGTGKQII